ncbi:MAG TPA: dihydrolipoyl dehydrogenase [Candidatus Dormibacteraeota bacterium]
MPEVFDVAVLGGGSGGYVGAIRAAQLGLRVIVVEEDKVGGTCLHKGCIPTKALLQTAALLDELHGAGRLGVRVDDFSLDHNAASRRKTEVVAQLHRGVEFLLRKHKVETVAARGRLAGPNLVVAGDREIAAEHVIVATGSRPRSLPGLEVDGSAVITSDEALTLDRVPASAVILGAGAIGVEFASLYRSFGAEVTLVEMEDSLVPLEDHEVGAELERQFSARGIRCLAGHRLDIASLQRNEGGIAVTVARPGGPDERLQAELLLVAVGRAPNVEAIGLETTAVQTAVTGVAVDASMRTAQWGISAVGDVTGGFLLAHKAMHEGVVAAETIAGLPTQPVDSERVPRTTYCTPQIGSLGLSERQAQAAGHAVSTGVFPFRGNARALIWGEQGGFCKVVADATTNDVLGVHFIGHEVTELIAGPALGALLEATPFELARAIAPHPTLSEVLGEAALAVSGEAIHL